MEPGRRAGRRPRGGFPDGFDEAHRDHVRLAETLRKAAVYPCLRVYALRARLARELLSGA